MSELYRLWTCWIAAREHRKPHWQTWARLLAQMPVIRDQLESEPYYSIYKNLIEQGQHRVEPTARGRWVGKNWVMRSIS